MSGFPVWLVERGVERVTVHGLAAWSNRRVRDTRFLLSCEGIPVDHRLDTVSLRAVIESGLCGQTAKTERVEQEIRSALAAARPSEGEKC